MGGDHRRRRRTARDPDRDGHDRFERTGQPPLPLFFSELFVLVGGVLAAEIWVVAVAAALLALGFPGLSHALIEGLAGRSRRRGEAVDEARVRLHAGLRPS